MENATIVVRDGKIAAVGPVASTTVPAGAERVDVKGATIMPGHRQRARPSHRRQRDAQRSQRLHAREPDSAAEYVRAATASRRSSASATIRKRRFNCATSRPGTLTRSRFFIAGPVINGANADAARAMTDKVAAMKPDLLKIRIDDNLGLVEEDARGRLARDHRAREGAQAADRRSHLLSRRCEGRAAWPARPSSRTACAMCRWTRSSSAR